MTMQPNGPLPHVWEDGLLEIRVARPAPLPLVEPTAPNHPGGGTIRLQTITSGKETLAESTLTQPIAGCGIAAIDGYLAMRDYAAAKGLDLAELHHKGIDFQDLLSTVIIHVQKTAEMEGRATGARWKR